MVIKRQKYSFKCRKEQYCKGAVEVRHGRSKRKSIHEKRNRQKQPPQVFYKKGILKNFANFTGKHLCFPVKFAKFLGTPILKNICEQLLLDRRCECDVDDMKRTRTNALVK